MPSGDASASELLAYAAEKGGNDGTEKDDNVRADSSSFKFLS